MTYREAQTILNEFQAWRRGIGKYAWNPEPGKNAKLPYSPDTLGLALDCALSALAEVAKRRDSKAIRRTAVRGKGKAMSRIATSREAR